MEKLRKALPKEGEIHRRKMQKPKSKITKIMTLAIRQFF